ncbi:hypothetical protein CAI16_04145 [Virgibacillus dokdonensis]|uniref:Probable cytosol aminopeptidase n=1 Tax=Virgibacillus dokdonensis TaxID=302167 RepID=A0A3E0WX42_9BACI|nr:leucyl aminopeptidase family protein [Virgibacillus dokdonensis]RFA36586.1 hypothetical protein CAI16_04145 [Virgibacillus dokdonensis]
MEIYVCPLEPSQLFKHSFVEKASFGEMKLFYTETTIYLLVCICPVSKNMEDIRHLGGEIRKKIDKEFLSLTVTINFNGLFKGWEHATEESDIASYVTAFMEGWYLAGYRFQYYKRNRLEMDYVLEYNYSSYSAYVALAKTKSDAVCLARDLCNEPPSKLTPEAYASKIVEIFRDTDVDVAILDTVDLTKHGLEAIKTVGKGSVHPPKMVVLTLKNTVGKHVALVGKGVTFDAGGVNVKTGTGLWEMKMDMGGSAAVVGAMKLLSDLNSSVYVTAVIPLVENVVGKNAYLPADVISYANGMHVEVGNTDAEGRLILADGILYAQDVGAETIIDIATLTGSIGQALGLKTAGVFTNNEKDLWTYREIGEETGDHVWPMPLIEDYKAYLHSDYADLNNRSASKYGGSITAAIFLQQFIKQHMKWLHIDMANTVRPWKVYGYHVEGATGFGVRLLTKLVEKEFERRNAVGIDCTE